MTPEAAAMTHRRRDVTRLATVAVAGVASVLGGARITAALPGSAHHGGRIELASAREPCTADAAGWLTAVLRPAGTLDRAALGRLGPALDRLAATSDMVVLDLTAARVAAPRAVARTLRSPAAELHQPQRCLLLVGAPLDLVAELNRAAIPVATLPAGSLPLAAT
jgi:hypothetical protein